MIKIHQITKKSNTSVPKNFQKIDDIYIKLINTTGTKVPKIQDSIKRIAWISSTIDELTQNTEAKIKKARTQQTTGFLMKKYLGRVNSYFRKINNTL